MKKCIITFCLLLLFAIVYIYRVPLFYFYQTHILKEKETLEIETEYYRNYNFNYIQQIDTFSPKSKQDIKNIYYTILNAGKTDFSFYCPREYSTCIEEVKELAEDQVSLSYINNFVHPYHSFKHIETTYDNYGKISISIEPTYSKTDISLLNTKVKEIETQIWNDSMTEKEKIKQAHDYIIQNTKYDTQRSDLNIIHYQSDTAIGPLLEGYGLCGGYTDAMALFLEDLHLRNYKVASENHIWNALEYNGQWYHIDLTWDDPLTQSGQDLLEDDFFFLSTTELEQLEQEQHTFDKTIYSELKN